MAGDTKKKDAAMKEAKDDGSLYSAEEFARALRLEGHHVEFMKKLGGNEKHTASYWRKWMKENGME